MAQDIQFSQFYATSLYINPAFAGSSHFPRAIIHNRIQWPKLDARFNTYLASFDAYLPEVQSGVGIMFLHDRQGSALLNSTEVHLQYSYELPVSDKVTVRAGLQLGAVNRSLDYGDLSFTYQFSNAGQTSTVADQPADERFWYADVAAGALVYSDRFWFGLATHHLNQPNVSVYSNQARVPVKASFVAGYKIDLSGKGDFWSYDGSQKEISLTPTVHYKFQGESDQVDAGLYGLYDHFLLGVWYRGIPFKKIENGVPNNESMIFMGGWRIAKDLEFRYSYDLTVSRLRQARTGGAHEISLAVLLRQKRKKPMKRLPCPTHHTIKEYNFL